MLPMLIISTFLPRPMRTDRAASRPPRQEHSRAERNALASVRRMAWSITFSTAPMTPEAAASRALPPKKREKEAEMRAKVRSCTGKLYWGSSRMASRARSVSSRVRRSAQMRRHSRLSSSSRCRSYCCPATRRIWVSAPYWREYMVTMMLEVMVNTSARSAP